jgi:hypothetical protein
MAPDGHKLIFTIKNELKDPKNVPAKHCRPAGDNDDSKLVINS